MNLIKIYWCFVFFILILLSYCTKKEIKEEEIPKVISESTNITKIETNAIETNVISNIITNTNIIVENIPTNIIKNEIPKPKEPLYIFVKTNIPVEYEYKTNFLLTTNKILSGHRNYIFSVDFSPDSKYLASGAADQTVKIWNVETGELVRNITIQFNGIWGMPVRFTKDNKYLIVGAYENLKVFDLENFKEVADQFAHRRGIQSINISKDNNFLVSAGVDGKINVWEIPTLKLLKSIQGHEREIWSVAVCPNYDYIISGGEDGILKIWSIPDLELLNTVYFHDFPLEYVKFTDDGKYILIGSMDSTISVWNPSEPKYPIKYFTGHSKSVLVSIFSKDGNYIFSGSDDKSLYVFDFNENRLIQQEMLHRSDVMGLAISPDGRYLASCSRDRNVILWNITNRVIQWIKR